MINTIGYIYKITNDINDKVYIGKTLKSITKRFKEHIHESTRKRSEKRPLYAAMNKYGIEHFSIELIEEVDSSILEEREIYWIQQYNSYHYGYNATHGGDGKILYDDSIRQEMINEYKNGQLIKEIAAKHNCTEKTVHNAIVSAGLDVNSNKSNRLMISVSAYKDGKLIQSFKSLNLAGQWIYTNGYTQSQNLDCIAVAIGRVRDNPYRTAYGFTWKTNSHMDIEPQGEK